MLATLVRSGGRRKKTAVGGAGSEARTTAGKEITKCSDGVVGSVSRGGQPKPVHLTAFQLLERALEHDAEAVLVQLPERDMRFRHTYVCSGRRLRRPSVQ
jgi:hypothetical protein